jgi:hypothetical protein
MNRKNDNRLQKLGGYTPNDNRSLDELKPPNISQPQHTTGNNSVSAKDKDVSVKNSNQVNHRK